MKRLSQESIRSEKTSRSLSWWALLGPGIVWASTSIGVSHVVQSTRAGAVYGLGMLVAILVAHATKYPFFEMGPRYAAATGESLIEGYRRSGPWAVPLFLGLTLLTMFIIQAAVTIVTAGLIANLSPVAGSVSAWSAVVLVVVIATLMAGGFALMNNILKVMMAALAIVLMITVVATLVRVGLPDRTVSFTWDSASIAFLVALVGWMPTTIEISVWHSIWTLKKKQKTAVSLANALLDFRVGYVFCFVIAVFFLYLGSAILGGAGTLPNSAVAFTKNLIDMFTQTLGSWSWPFVAFLCFIAMFSTCLAVANGFTVVWTRIMPAAKRKAGGRLTLLILCAGAWVVIAFSGDNLKALVDLATTLSFTAAPLFAWLNLRAMGCEQVPAAARLRGASLVYSWVCLVLLSLFSIFFIVWRFF